jgi:hypothetical protein
LWENLAVQKPVVTSFKEGVSDLDLNVMEITLTASSPSTCTAGTWRGQLLVKASKDITLNPTSFADLADSFNKSSKGTASKLRQQLEPDQSPFYPVWSYHVILLLSFCVSCSEREGLGQSQ